MSIYLKHHVSDNIFRKELFSMIISFFHHLIQILLHVFKNKIESVILPYNL